MKNVIRRLGLVLLFTVSTSGGVVYAYQASPDCARWISEHAASVHKIVDKIHHLSKERVAAILAWNAKYGPPKSRKDTLRRYELACGDEAIDLLPSEDAALVPDTPIAIPASELIEPVEVAPEADILNVADGYDFLHSGEEGDGVVEMSDGPPVPYYPYYPDFPWAPQHPDNPGAPIGPVQPTTPTPEPGSLFLLGTGLVWMAMRVRNLQGKSK